MSINPIEKLNTLLAKLVIWFFGLFGVKSDSKLVVTIIQLIKFGLVGVLNFLVTTVVYAILVSLGVSTVISYAIGYACGIVNSYICNKLWTFSSKETKPLVESIKFFALCLVAYVLSQLVLLGLEPALGNALAYIIATVLALAVNYLGSKFLVFKK